MFDSRQQISTIMQFIQRVLIIVNNNGYYIFIISEVQRGHLFVFPVHHRTGSLFGTIFPTICARENQQDIYLIAGKDKRCFQISFRPF